MLFSWGFLADMGVILVRHFNVHKNYIKFHYNVFNFVDVFTVVFSLLIYLKVNRFYFSGMEMSCIIHIKANSFSNIIIFLELLYFSLLSFSIYSDRFWIKLLIITIFLYFSKIQWIFRKKYIWFSLNNFRF